MKKSITFIIISLATVFFAGCDESEVQQISKEGAVETIMNVDHLDQSHDIIITTHKVWIKNQLAKTIIYRDTIPSLGLITQEAENSDGDTKNVTLKKDYEVYITVK